MTKEQRLEKCIRKLVHKEMKVMLETKPWERLVEYGIYENPEFQKAEQLFEDDNERMNVINKVLEKVEKAILKAILS